MRTFVKPVAAALVTIALSGAANAEEGIGNASSADLGLVIALQGDQALVDIHKTVADSISQSIRQQMVVSLTGIASVEGGTMTALAHRDAAAASLVAHR